MAHVKIYGRRDVWQDRRGSVSDAVHRAIVGTWGLPPEKRFHRFFLLDSGQAIGRWWLDDHRQQPGQDVQRC